jgi:hypothetical protein
MYVYCVYPAMQNYLNRAETNVFLILFMVSSVKFVLKQLPFATVALNESGTRKALLGP